MKPLLALPVFVRMKVPTSPKQTMNSDELLRRLIRIVWEYCELFHATQPHIVITAWWRNRLVGTKHWMHSSDQWAGNPRARPFLSRSWNRPPGIKLWAVPVAGKLTCCWDLCDWDATTFVDIYMFIIVYILDIYLCIYIYIIYKSLMVSISNFWALEQTGGTETGWTTIYPVSDLILY